MSGYARAEFERFCPSISPTRSGAKGRCMSRQNQSQRPSKHSRLALRARGAVDPSESGYLAYRADSSTSRFGRGGTQNSNRRERPARMISPGELECSVRQWFGMGVGSPFGGVYPRRWCVDSRLSTPPTVGTAPGVSPLPRSHFFFRFIPCVVAISM